MDEMTSVRGFRPDVTGPSDEERRRARARLNEAIAAEARAASGEAASADPALGEETVLSVVTGGEWPAGDSPGRGTRSGRRGPRRGWKSAAVAAGVAVLVAVPIAVISRSDGGHQTVAVQAATTGPAARTCPTVTVPPAPPIPAGSWKDRPGPFGYRETVYARTADGHSAGNPVILRDWAGPSAYAILDPQLQAGMRIEDATYFVGTTRVTLADLSRLPADPATLRRMLTAGEKEPVEDRTILAAVADLALLPVGPDVQRALFTIVGGLGSARVNVHDTDLIGRPAVSVTVPDSHNPGNLDRLLFSPGDHRYLGDEAATERNPCGFGYRSAVLATGSVPEIGQTVNR